MISSPGFDTWRTQCRTDRRAVDSQVAQERLYVGPIGARCRLRPVLQELEVGVVPVQEHGLVDDLTAKAAHCYGSLCEKSLGHSASAASSGHRSLRFLWSYLGFFIEAGVIRSPTSYPFSLLGKVT